MSLKESCKFMLLAKILQKVMLHECSSKTNKNEKSHWYFLLSHLDKKDLRSVSLSFELSGSRPTTAYRVDDHSHKMANLRREKNRTAVLERVPAATQWSFGVIHCCCCCCCCHHPLAWGRMNCLGLAAGHNGKGCDCSLGGHRDPEWDAQYCWIFLGQHSP